MIYDGMTHEEAMALTNFVLKRVMELDPEPKFFGRRKWRRRVNRFRHNFRFCIENGLNSFYGAIWEYFDGTGDLLMGDNGMKELAEHTYKEKGSWIYRKPNETSIVIYTEAKDL